MLFNNKTTMQITMHVISFITDLCHNRRMLTRQGCLSVYLLKCKDLIVEGWRKKIINGVRINLYAIVHIFTSLCKIHVSERNRAKHLFCITRNMWTITVLQLNSPFSVDFFHLRIHCYFSCEYVSASRWILQPSSKRLYFIWARQIAISL